MTNYTVQFVLPVDNPVNKVIVTKNRGSWCFEVPVNHPEAHTMGFMDLVAAAELSGLLGLSTDSNNKSLDRLKKSIHKKSDANNSSKQSPDTPALRDRLGYRERSGASDDSIRKHD